MFDPKLFRASAIQHYLDREREGVPAPLRIAPAWTWWVFWVLASSLVMTLVLSVALKIEVQGTGRGVIRIAGGARTLMVQTSGRVARVAAYPGQMVAPGDLILELDSAPIQAQLMEADRALAQSEKLTLPAQAGLDLLAEAQIKEALRRQDAQEEQLKSLQQSVGLFERKFIATEKLGRHGLVSAINVEEAKEALAQANRSVNSGRQALMATKQEVTSLIARRNGDNLRNLQETETLRTKRDSLVFSMAQTRVTASEAGIVEGLHVRAGDVVNTGQSVGRLLTGGGSPMAFALLAEKDRAKVHPTDAVRLEVDQFPVGEWGVLKGTIHRIGESPVSLAELREFFGEETKIDSASYLVEIAIPSGQSRPIARQQLQSGMAFQARYTLQRQRPISFLLEPLRRLFE